MKRQTQFDQLQQLENLAPQQAAPVNRTTSTQAAPEGPAVEACLQGVFMLPFADDDAA